MLLRVAAKMTILKNSYFFKNSQNIFSSTKTMPSFLRTAERREAITSLSARPLSIKYLAASSRKAVSFQARKALSASSVKK